MNYVNEGTKTCCPWKGDCFLQSTRIGQLLHAPGWGGTAQPPVGPRHPNAVRTQAICGPGHTIEREEKVRILVQHISPSIMSSGQKAPPSLDNTYGSHSLARFPRPRLDYHPKSRLQVSYSQKEKTSQFKCLSKLRLLLFLLYPVTGEVTCAVKHTEYCVIPKKANERQAGSSCCGCWKTHGSSI